MSTSHIHSAHVLLSYNDLTNILPIGASDHLYTYFYSIS